MANSSIRLSLHFIHSKCTPTFVSLLLPNSRRRPFPPPPPPPPPPLFIFPARIWEMFNEVELVRNVEITVEKEKRDVLNFQRYIITCLLENLLKEKANKDHGYFLSVTSLKSIGKGVVKNESRCLSFPITFSCRTFLPSEGEILHGVVRHIFRRGLLLKCGPIKYVFLSARKMPTYHYVGGENPVFSSNKFATIGNDVVVRFSVLGVRWIEKRGCIKKEFVMLASLEGNNSLGPISLSDSDEFDL